MPQQKGITNPVVNGSQGNKVFIKDLLKEYRHEPELLKYILASKQEEDKLMAEEVRYNTELIKLESKKIELEIAKQNNMDSLQLPQIKDSQYYKKFLPNYQVASQQKNSSISPKNKLSLPVYPKIQTKPIDTRYNLRNTEPVSKDMMPKRKMSHEHVMEALRNKVRANHQLRTQTNYVPILPTMKKQDYNGDKNTTLSSIQPKENESYSTAHYVGPFSAPVRNHPGTAFPYPPIEHLEKTKIDIKSESIEDKE